MLEGLRNIQKSWVGKAAVAVVMGLLMISFVIWGIGPVFTGFNANTLATVGSDTVTVDAFRQAYQTELQQLQQRARRAITNAQAHQFGLDTQVLSRLVSEAVLDEEAAAMGLSISQDQIAKAITTDPGFAGPNGQFDKSRFDEALRENDMTEQRFVREQRRTYLRQELIQALVGGIEVPQAAVEAMHQLQAETRSVDYFVLTPAAVEPIPAPDDAALNRFFDDRAATFRAPEFRKLAVVALLPATLAKPDAVSDGDVQALYDKVKEQRFTTPETRDLQQIVYPNEADATAASQSLGAGKTFADLAAERKLTDKDVDLGRVTRSSIFEKAVADAAFALPENGVSAPVKTAFGFTLVHVVGIAPSVVKPLAEVAAALRLEIAASRTGDAIRTAHDRIEDARNAGQTLSDAAKAAGVAIVAIDDVDAAGRDKTGAAVDMPDKAALLKAAFASDVGVENDALRTPDGGQVFYDVTGIAPAHAQSFAEVKPAVEAAWRAEETRKRLAAKAAELVKAIAGGLTIEAVAAAQGNLAIKHLGDVRRGGGTGLSAAVVAAIFAEPADGVGAAAGDDGSRIVFKELGSVVPPLDPDSPQAKELTSQYQTALGEDLLSTYLNQKQASLGVRINPTAFNAAVGAN